MKLSNFWVDTLSSDRWPHSRCICYNLHIQMYSMYVHPNRFSAFWLRSKLLEANFDSSFKDNVLSYGPALAETSGTYVVGRMQRRFGYVVEGSMR